VILLSLDRTNRERELASYLISTLAGGTLRAAEVEKGFEILLYRVDDIVNDVPKVLELLSTFLARAVADECLPPAFLVRANLPPNDLGGQVVKQAELLLSKKHAAARLARVWGPGDGRSVPQLKKVVKESLAEFLESGDIDEAKKCVKDLNAPYFYHEVVKRLIVLVLDKKDREIELCVKLLNALLLDQIVSERQIRMGVARVKQELADLSLDAPKAPVVFEQITKALALKD